MPSVEKLLLPGVQILFRSRREGVVLFGLILWDLNCPFSAVRRLFLYLGFLPHEGSPRRYHGLHQILMLPASMRTGDGHQIDFHLNLFYQSLIMLFLLS